MSKKLFTSIILALAVFLNGWCIVYAALTDNINAAYKFDSGALTTDSVAGTYTLTNVNTVGETASGLVGYGADYGSANTNKAFRINSAMGLTRDGAKTVSWWIKMQTDLADGVTQSFGYLMIGSNPGTYFGINYTRSGATYTVLGVSLTAPTIHTGALGTSDWHHIVVTQAASAGTVTWYFDGAQITTDTPNSGNYTALGNWFSLGQRYWTGVDDQYASIFGDIVNVWARELTADEVTSLYNAGAGNEYPFAVAGATPAPITSDLILFE